jgi:hypothetical protein
MGYYVAWGKKRQRLEELERDFAALLSVDPDAKATISEGIERMRIAHIRELKARRATLAPSERNAVAFKNFAEEIERWRSLPPDSILAQFKKAHARAAGPQ